jgi:prepilin-type N-terminal cleavage/methylation domain-containing protein
MLNILKKENGLTLIEILAALSILSFVTIIVMNVLINGVNFSNQAKDEALMQQEANLILRNLTTFHETKSAYEISLDNYPVGQVIALSSSTGDVTTISNPQLQYRLFISNEPLLEAQSLNAREESLSIKIVIEQRNNPDIKYEIKTVISRM